MITRAASLALVEPRNEDPAGSLSATAESESQREFSTLLPAPNLAGQVRKEAAIAPALQPKRVRDKEPVGTMFARTTLDATTTRFAVKAELIEAILCRRVTATPLPRVAKVNPFPFELENGATFPLRDVPLVHWDPDAAVCPILGDAEEDTTPRPARTF